MAHLVVTLHAPRADTGRSLRTYGTVRALANLAPVDLLYAPLEGEDPSEEFLTVPNLTLHRVEILWGKDRLLWYARARMRGVPRLDARRSFPEVERAARALSRSPGRQLVIADAADAATLLSKVARRRPVIYLAQNVESVLRPTLPDSRRLYGSTSLLRRFERRLLSGVAESWMVSKKDVRLAREIAPHARLRYVPNVIDVERIPQVGPAARARRIVFVGSFDYPPNAQGARFLIDAVMPRVWRDVPDAELVLVGRGLSLLPDEDERVKQMGFVADLAKVYGDCACVAVPLLEGGGSPLKFIEALAYGMPIVATPVAAQGLEVDAGTHYVEAGGPEEFAKALVSILEEGGGELGRRGRLLAESHYSIDALTDLLRDVVAARRTG